MNSLLTLIERSPTVLVAFWFVVGTIIGSFLNVVIYRLPQGMSLVSPPSRCPACGRSIRWYHNVPVLGWLLLGGKCHDCQSPISPRYPLVELFVGCLFAAMAYVDLIWEHARWLQLADANDPPVLTWLLRLGVHLLVLCPLFAAAMIEHDGRRAKKHTSPLRPAAIGFALVLLWFLFGQMAFE